MTNDIQLNGIYFYNGLYKPDKVAENLVELAIFLKSGELTIGDNYSGDANGDILELIIDEGNDLELLRDDLVSYNLWDSPYISDFKKINVESYGLGENCYLEGLEK